MVQEAPTAYGFNRNRKNFSIDIEKLFENPRNGMQMHTALDQEKIDEEQFRAWLLRVGVTNGTKPEFYVYRDLERRGLRAPESQPYPGLDFAYQWSAVGGRADEGGAVIDIAVFITSPQIAIRVQGEYWHFRDDPTEESDIIQRLKLEAAGWRVVDIFAQDTLEPRRLQQVVSLALLGWEVDISGRLEIFST